MSTWPALSAAWRHVGRRFLPFADAASSELPLPRLLRLSLFQVAVGMATVLLVGTLNRVMIVELGVPAGLVAAMVALPMLFAPLRALIGHRSDHHRSVLGWRRVPYIWMGSLIQFGGLATAAALAAPLPLWIQDPADDFAADWPTNAYTLAGVSTLLRLDDEPADPSALAAWLADGTWPASND